MTTIRGTIVLLSLSHLRKGPSGVRKSAGDAQRTHPSSERYIPTQDSNGGAVSRTGCHPSNPSPRTLGSRIIGSLRHEAQPSTSPSLARSTTYVFPGLALDLKHRPRGKICISRPKIRGRMTMTGGARDRSKGGLKGPGTLVYSRLYAQDIPEVRDRSCATRPLPDRACRHRRGIAERCIVRYVCDLLCVVSWWWWWWCGTSRMTHIPHRSAPIVTAAPVYYKPYRVAYCRSCAGEPIGGRYKKVYIENSQGFVCSAGAVPQ